MEPNQVETPLSDCQLMATLAGSQSAEEKSRASTALAERHYGACLALARKVLRGRAPHLIDLADDCVQEAMSKVIMSASSFDGSRPLKPWLMTIVKNQAGSLLRRSRRLRTLENGDQLVAPAETSDELERVAELLDQLPEDERAVLVALHLDGLSRTEVADRMGWSVERVYRVSFKARQRLRTIRFSSHQQDRDGISSGGRAMGPDDKGRLFTPGQEKTPPAC